MSAITGFRVVKPDMTSKDRFRYPSSGHVECEDFIDNHECGNGLHFWTEASCDFSSCSYHSPDNLWLIVEAENAINLGGKYKSKSLTVLEVLTLSEMVDRFPTLHFPYVFKQAGYGSTLTAGYGSTLTAGDRSVLIIFNAYGVPFAKKVTKISAGKPHVLVNGRIVLKRD